MTIKLQITLDDGTVHEVADVSVLPVVTPVPAEPSIEEVDVKLSDGTEETFVAKP